MHGAFFIVCVRAFTTACCVWDRICALARQRTPTNAKDDKHGAPIGKAPKFPHHACYKSLHEISYSSITQSLSQVASLLANSRCSACPIKREIARSYEHFRENFELLRVFAFLPHTLRCCLNGKILTFSPSNYFMLCCAIR